MNLGHLLSIGRLKLLYHTSFSLKWYIIIMKSSLQ